MSLSFGKDTKGAGGASLSIFALLACSFAALISMELADDGIELSDDTLALAVAEDESSLILLKECSGFSLRKGTICVFRPIPTGDTIRDALSIRILYVIRKKVHRIRISRITGYKVPYALLYTL